MTASLLSGTELSRLKRQALKQQIDENLQRGQPRPQLAVILIGEDPASAIYVNNKRKACVEVGIESLSYDLPMTTSQEDLLKLIEDLNQRREVNGILVQFPLPAHIDPTAVIEAIHPDKDVDGFHPYNLGRLAQRIPRLRPCTPLGIMSLLRHYQIPVKRQDCVVVGASNIVGRPMSLELLLAGATVTICHKFTRNLKDYVQRADLIVVATGYREVVDPQWLQSHQVLVDVGIHRLPDGQICGDVDFKEASERVAWITPVPGGVGPMTIVSLLENTLLAAAYQQE